MTMNKVGSANGNTMHQMRTEGVLNRDFTVVIKVVHIPGPP